MADSLLNKATAIEIHFCTRCPVIPDCRVSDKYCLVRLYKVAKKDMQEKRLR